MKLRIVKFKPSKNFVIKKEIFARLLIKLLILLATTLKSIQF